MEKAYFVFDGHFEILKCLSKFELSYIGCDGLTAVYFVI